MAGRLALLALFASSPATAFDLEPVLAAQERSMGDLSTVQTLSLSVRMDEPDARYDLAIRFARPASMRVDLRRLGLSVYSEGLGSRGPWEQNLLQWSPRPTSPAGGEAIRNGVEGFTWARSLREMRARGHAVEALGASTRTGEIGVRVRFRNGTERRYFLDPRTFRIARMEQDYALHPDMHGAASAIRTIESSWLDYRTVEGLVLPMRLVNRDRRSGEVVQTITVRDVRLNLPLDARIFEGR